MAITIRQFTPDDWQDYKKIRLEALTQYPTVFNPKKDEFQKTDDDWGNDLIGDNFAIFGAYDGHTIIGLTAIFTDRNDPSGQTAFLAMSYRNPDYKQSGLGDLYYKVRIEWACAHPKINKILVSHRKSNSDSMKANQRHGFNRAKEYDRNTIWPDGTREEECFYVLSVKDGKYSTCNTRIQQTL